MPKINQEEYEVLKGLDDKWKWIARNYNGALITYTDKPTKNPNLYWDSFGERMEDRLFQFIQWEDEEPHNVAELIEEYESEETEVKKGIEWLKRSIDKRIKTIESDDITFVGSEYYDEGYIDGMRDVLYRINQLDEPEVLSQELPVIPNYVAEWISEHREEFDLCPALRRLEAGSTRDHPAYKWYRKNTRKFVNAYLTGEYEVEPTYYAKIKGHENIGSNDKYWNYNTDMEELSIGDSEVHPNVISEYVLKATKDEWANLGITDDNADFELVEEMEEC